MHAINRSKHSVSEILQVVLLQASLVILTDYMLITQYASLFTHAFPAHTFHILSSADWNALFVLCASSTKYLVLALLNVFILSMVIPVIMLRTKETTEPSSESLRLLQDVPGTSVDMNLSTKMDLPPGDIRTNTEEVSHA